MPSLPTLLADPALFFLDTHLSQFAPGSPEYKLVSLFCYGTWDDYLTLEKTLPDDLKLDPNGAAAAKLRKLTLLSVFARPENEFTFDELLRLTGLSDYVKLESLLIELLCSRYLDAQIDEPARTIRVERVSARCIPDDRDALLKIAAKIRAVRDRVGKALQVAGTPQ
jgi:hypothetical protein